MYHKEKAKETMGDFHMKKPDYTYNLTVGGDSQPYFTYAPDDGQCRCTGQCRCGKHDGGHDGNACGSDGDATFQAKLDGVLGSLRAFLLAKNANYGNSALEPLRVFSKSSSEDGILKRMDDKLSRIKNSQVLRKNDIVDLAGYLVILCINNGWTNFDEMID